MFCEKCGEKMHDSATYCEKCGHSMPPAIRTDPQSTSVTYDTPQEPPKKENFPLGLLGALLGALIGGGCIVGLYMAGYLASFTGVVLAFATFKGYELLGKKLSKKGILICLLLVIVMPYLSIRLAWTITLVQETGWPFMDTFLEIEDMINRTNFGGDYLAELGKTYLFTALGAIAPLSSVFKKRK